MLKKLTLPAALCFACALPLTSCDNGTEGGGECTKTETPGACEVLATSECPTDRLAEGQCILCDKGIAACFDRNDNDCDDDVDREDSDCACVPNLKACQSQAECGSMTKDAEIPLCLDQVCTPAGRYFCGTTFSKRHHVSMRVVFDDAAKLTQPKSLRFRAVHPVLTDGTPLTCQTLLPLLGKTQAEVKKLDDNPAINQHFRIAKTVAWTTSTTSYTFPLDLPESAEALLVAESWSGAMTDTNAILPAGSGYGVACIEGVQIKADLAEQRFDITAY